MIAADAQQLARDLQRQMPVAEMPGDAKQRLPVRRRDLAQRLRGGAHADEAAAK
jgi:hypothetical protein